MERGTVSDISVSYDISVISVNNTDFSKINEIISLLSDINVDMITMADTSSDLSTLMISVSDSDASACIEKINSATPSLSVLSSGNAKVSIRGAGFKNSPEKMAFVVDDIIDCGVDIKLFSFSDTDFTVICDSMYASDVLAALKKYN